MAVTTAPIASIGSYAARRERRKAIAYGVFFLLVALAIFVFFVRNSAPGMESTFKLNPTTKEKVIQLGDLVLPTYQTLIILATVISAVGLYQLVKGFKRAVLVLGIVALLFVFAFLVWGVRDKSINLLGILTFTVAAATPIAFGAMSGVMCERSGVINIAIEGMMLTGAMVAVIFSSVTIFALGITSFISQRFLQPNPALNSGGVFSKIAIPGLSQIPIIGPVFFNQSPIVYILFLTVIGIHFMLFYTRWGLRTRAVGEHPRAADTLGVNVFKIRYVNVIIGGMIAGVGGAYFTIGSVGRFDEAITAGKGFIGLAAMIFGRWTPLGAYGASLIFGFSDALQARLQVLGKTQVPIPSEWLLILPYLVTMIVLAGVVGKTVAPAADGKPYTKD